jgi:hypothetical protein
VPHSFFCNQASERFRLCSHFFFYFRSARPLRGNPRPRFFLGSLRRDILSRIAHLHIPVQMPTSKKSIRGRAAQKIKKEMGAKAEL